MKLYQTPEFSIISLANDDILTMSLASNGTGILDTYNFDDLVI